MKKSKSIFLAVVTICLLSIVLTNCGKSGAKTQVNEPPRMSSGSSEPGGGAVIHERKTDNRMMTLQSVKLSSNEYEANGVSAQAETAYALTVTILPADATDKKVNYTSSFVNASSSWASGKRVSDYVRVTPSSDGALTATVECLQGFSEQINITISSRSNPEVKAECTVDYVKRVERASVSIGGSDTVVCSEAGTVYAVTLEPQYTAGTIDSVTEIEFIELQLSTEVMTTIRNSSSMLQYAVFEAAELTTEKRFTSSQAFLDGLFKGTRNTPDGEITKGAIQTKLYNNALKSACLDTGITHATISVKYRNYYGEETYINATEFLEVKFDLSALATAVTELTANTETIVF